MTLTLRRILLVLLLLTGVYIGGWAYVAPGSWYASFPGFGFRWLPPLGPFNEHLAKDVGAMFLGLGVLSAGGLIMVTNGGVVGLVAATWSVFNVLHLVFHLQMLSMYGTVDKVLVVTVLSALVVVAAALFAPVRGAGSPGDV
jgi:hypothetical protein